MASELSPVGCATLTSYFHTARAKRDQTIKALDMEFSSFKDTSMMDMTYTRGDVDQLLMNYLNILKVSLNKQYSDYIQATTDVGLDILEQADGKEVLLSIDSSRFTNANIEKETSALENELTKKDSQTLVPDIGTRGVDPRKKLMDAQQETKRLVEKAHQIQHQFNTMMKEKTAVQTDLNEELDVLKTVKELGTSPSEVTLSRLQEELDKLEKDTDAVQQEAKGIHVLFFIVF